VRNVRHVCDGGRRGLFTSRETVRSETAIPNLPNSPWIRGAPQSGFAVAIFITSVRIVAVVLGRPERPRAERRVHWRRSHWRCQRKTVSGCTTIRAVRQSCHALASKDPKQSISMAELGTPHAALEHGQLLTECQILEGDRLVSIADQRERSKRDDERSQHELSCPAISRRINRNRRSDSGERHPCGAEGLMTHMRAFHAATLVTALMGSLGAADDLLNAAIGRPNRALYRSIKDERDWQNPVIIVQDDGVDVQAKGITGINGRKHVPVDALKGLLMSLPVDAWPYGRVVALTDQGIFPAPLYEDVRKMALMRTRVRAVLKSLRITAEFWPA
jgi:hypothetical protein